MHTIIFAFVMFSVGLTLTVGTNGQNLTAVHAGYMPFESAEPHAIYDGDDTIFLFADSNGSFPPAVLKYTVSNGRISIVATLQQRLGTGSSLQYDNDGRILCFDGNSRGPSPVYRFNPTSHALEQVAAIPYGIREHSSVPSNGSVIIFAGDEKPRTITRFDVDDLRSVELGATLPLNSWGSKSVVVGGQAYLFRGSEGEEGVLKIDLQTFQIIPVGGTQFPEIWSRSTAIHAGRHIYVLGCFLGQAGNSLVEFDPNTLTHRIVHLNDFIQEDECFGFAPKIVFVEKLNRLYLFGGFISGHSDEWYTDSIWYIDL